LALITLRGHVNPISTAERPIVEGFRVTATLTRLVRVTDAADHPIPTTASGGGLAAADGAFELDIGGEGEAHAPVLVDVAAPDGQLVHHAEFSLDEVAKPLTLLVEGLAELLIAPAEDGTRGGRVSVAGRVVDEAGQVVRAGLPVVLWGVPKSASPAAAPQPLVITKTQTGGYFSGDWVSSPLSVAFGRVDGSAALPIRLEDERMPRHLLLVLQLPAPGGGDERPPAVPEPADLTRNPAAFSQDLGRGCLNLTAPNRTVEEFIYTLVVRTSEPDVKGLTLSEHATVPKETLSIMISAAALQEVMAPSAVPSIDLSVFDNLRLDVRSAKLLAASDNPPSLTDIGRAAWLSEVGRAKEIINAALIAPAMRQPLDADHSIDWDATPTIYQAVTIARGHLLEFREVWRADGYSLGDLLHSLPLAPGQRRQVAIVDWERRTIARRAEALEFEEQLQAYVGRDRDLSEIVGSRLSEETAGASRNSTWGVAGGIGAGFVGAGFGIFGGVAGGASGSRSDAWQESSRRFTSDSLQSLRDRVMQRASALRDMRSTVVQGTVQGETQRAETETLANYNHCHAMTIEYFEVLRHFVITHEVANVRECLFVPMQIREFDAAKALRWQTALMAHLREPGLRPGFEAIRRVADKWEGWDYPLSRYSEEAPQVLEGELRMTFVLPRPRDKDDGTFQIDMWEKYRSWLWMDTFELWNTYLRQAAAEYNAAEIAKRDRQFREKIAPEIAKRVMDRLRFAYVTSAGGEIAVPLDATLVSTYAEGIPLYVTLRANGALPALPREEIAQFKIWLDGADLPENAQLIVASGKMRYQTEHRRWLLFSDERILNDLSNTDPVYISTPTTWPERADPRQEDRELVDRLVAHLNAAPEYYHQVIWMRLDAQRRFMLLDGILVPGLDGKSVASVVENRLIGLAGNSLIFPLAPGMRIDPAVSDKSKGNLIDLYAADAPPPLRVSLPTRGVYAEAMLGECDACEAVDDSRYWRWTDAGMLAPPVIAPVSTESRAGVEETLKETALPTPLVSIQNAPELPNPVGLGEIFKLLARPDLFTDITGLEGTQKNARAAFDAALSATSALASQAAQLAGQNITATNGERMLDRINRAQQDGLLTSGAAQELSTKVFGSMVGAPDAKADKKLSSPAADPAVQKAIDKAAQGDNGQVKVSTVDETIEMSFAGGDTKAGGAAPVPAMLDVTDNWLDQPVVLDTPIGATGARVWSMKTIDKLDTLKKEYPAITAAIPALFLRENPADKTRFQFLGRLRIVYPALPGKLDQVAGTDRLPLAILVHGQHNSWPGGDVRNHEGFTFLQNHLAKLGIVSVSVDTNAANSYDSFIEMRAQIILAAIDYMRLRDKDPNSRFRDRLDFDRVGLMGHSRGGDAVVRAAVLNAATSRCAIKAVALIAPTDFTGTFASAGQLQVDSANGGFLFVMYGGLDGDVSGAYGARSLTGTGFRHYDRASAAKAMLYVPGCCHNRFNSIWTADESGLLSSDVANVHRRDHHDQLLADYVGGLFDWKLRGRSASSKLFNGAAISPLGHPSALRWAWGAHYKMLDDCENPAAAVVGPRVLRNADIAPFADVKVKGAALEPNVPHQTSILAIQENLAAPQLPSLELSLPAGQRDWSGFDLLTFDLGTWIDVASPATIAAGISPPRLSLTLTDGAGKVASVHQTAFTSAAVPGKPVFHMVTVTLPSKFVQVNASLHRLVTCAAKLSGFAAIDLHDVRKLLITGPLAFPQRIFVDSIALVQP
jgi:hypothetical protein